MIVYYFFTFSSYIMSYFIWDKCTKHLSCTHHSWTIPPQYPQTRSNLITFTILHITSLCTIITSHTPLIFQTRSIPLHMYNIHTTLLLAQFPNQHLHHRFGVSIKFVEETQVLSPVAESLQIKENNYRTVSITSIPCRDNNFSNISV